MATEIMKITIHNKYIRRSRSTREWESDKRKKSKKKKQFLAWHVWHN
jgi:hypothetical protein